MNIKTGGYGIFSFVFLAAFFFFAEPAGAADSRAAMFEKGKGRDDVQAAVLPTQLENADDISWAASVLPNQIVGILNRFSEIQILSRDQNTLNQIQKELEFQLSFGSETNSPALGEFTNGEYLITSKLTKTGRNVFNLHLEFIQLQRGDKGTISPVIIAAGNDFFSQTDLRENAVKVTLNAMFPDMGVILSSAGTAELLAGVQVNKIQARTAMAQAEDADFAGNSFDSLFYKNRAKQLDSSIGKGLLRQSRAEEDLLGTGTGTAIADDAAAQRKWNENILKMEKLFVDHPPFQLYYTPNPKQFGNTDYASNTASLEFSISLRRSVDLRVSQTMLNDVSRGLQKTGNVKKWGLEGWPQSPIQDIYNREKIPHFEGLRQYLVTAELVNDRDETILAQTFSLHSQLLLSGARIGADSSQRLRVIFPNVPVENTSRTHVKISAINGYPVLGKDRSGEKAGDFIQVTPVKRLPFRQAPSIPAKKRLVPEVAQFPVLIPPPPAPRQNLPAPVPAAPSSEEAAALAAEQAPGELAAPPSLAELAREQQEQAEQDELTRRQQELARQQEEFNRQQRYREEQEAIEREQRELVLRRQQEEAASKQREQEAREQERQREREARQAKKMAIPTHNRLGLGAVVLTDFQNWDLLSFKGDLEIGFANLTLEGVFAAPLHQNIYDVPGADHDRVRSGSQTGATEENNFVSGLGGGLGYTFYSTYFLGTISLGCNHWIFVDNEYINMPYLQIKADLLPFKKGLGLRLGYLIEGANPGWGGAYTRYFNERWTYEAGNFRLYNRFQAGLVLWI